jgi:hypothetical protein
MRFTMLSIILLVLGALGLASPTTPPSINTPINTPINPTATFHDVQGPTTLSRPQFADSNRAYSGLPGGLYVCEGDHWTGYCAWISPEHLSGCTRLRVPMPDGSPRNTHPKSFGPDKGGSCVVYKGEECVKQDIVWWGGEPGVEAGMVDFGAVQCFPDGTAA